MRYDLAPARDLDLTGQPLLLTPPWPFPRRACPGVEAEARQRRLPPIRTMSPCRIQHWRSAVTCPAHLPSLTWTAWLSNGSSLLITTSDLDTP